MGYNLRYRTFDELLTESFADMEKYFLSGMIQPHQLIKVAKRVNYELGLRIYQTHEGVLEVEKGRVRLPNNFYTLNYAFMCGQWEEKIPISQGTHVEERRVDIPTYQWQPDKVDKCCTEVVPSTCPSCQTTTPCGCETSCPAPQPKVCLNCKGEAWELIQVVKFQTRSYKTFFPLKVLTSSQDVSCECPNLQMDSVNTAWIKDGWLYTNFDCGTVYINYQGLMEDDDGNILVPDHELLNEFYEYAMKKRIIENLIMNDEPVAAGKIQLIEANFRTARIAALSLVRMPDFAELKKVYDSNRKAQRSRYYDMFSSFDGFNGYGRGFVRE